MARFAWFSALMATRPYILILGEIGAVHEQFVCFGGKKLRARINEVSV
jgi:hypothetical protein